MLSLFPVYIQRSILTIRMIDSLLVSVNLKAEILFGPVLMSLFPKIRIPEKIVH
jgi:hypothetical protein